MAQARVTYLSEGEKDFIHEQTLRVLAEVGVAYNSPTRDRPASPRPAREVDRERLTAKLTWELDRALSEHRPAHGPARRPRGPRTIACSASRRW